MFFGHLNRVWLDFTRRQEAQVKEIKHPSEVAASVAAKIIPDNLIRISIAISIAMLRNPDI